METKTHPLARLGLLLNGTFSLITGALLAAAPSTVGGWLGVEIDGWLRLFGVALIGHFFIVIAVIRMADIEPWTKLNLAMVAPYPLMMIGLVVSGLVEKGQALVLLDGAIVGAFAVMQRLGLRRPAEIPSAQIA